MSRFYDSSEDDLSDLELVLPSPMVTPNSKRFKTPPPHPEDQSLDAEWADLLDDVGVESVLRSVEKYDRVSSRPLSPFTPSRLPKINPNGTPISANPNKRRVRAPRQPRKRKLGEWNSDLSESENVDRSRRHRGALNRRRRKYRHDNSMAMVDRVPEDSRVKALEGLSLVEEMKEMEAQEFDEWCRIAESRKRPRSVLKPLVREHGETDSSFARRTRMRRYGRSVTPEWIDLEKGDEYMYWKVCSIDGKPRVLKEFTKKEYEKEFTDFEGYILCGVCDGQHTSKVCPKLQARSDIQQLERLLNFK
jgi:hypothetical protein